MMLTPSQQFQQAKKEMETLQNNYVMQLRQEQNKQLAEMRKRFEDIPALISEEVQRELQTHLLLIHESIQRIEQKLKHHFGT